MDFLVVPVKIFAEIQAASDHDAVGVSGKVGVHDFDANQIYPGDEGLGVLLSEGTIFRATSYHQRVVEEIQCDFFLGGASADVVLDAVELRNQIARRAKNLRLERDE